VTKIHVNTFTVYKLSWQIRVIDSSHKMTIIYYCSQAGKNSMREIPHFQWC